MDVEAGGGVAVSVVVRAEAVVAQVSDWERSVLMGFGPSKGGIKSRREMIRFPLSRADFS